MKKRRRPPVPRTEPRFRPLSSTAWGLRRRLGDEATVRALERAVNEARQLGFAYIFDNLDKVLSIADPWADRDILRGHILSDGDPPPGAKFALAFVRSERGMIEPTRWYLLPPATVGDLDVRVVAIAVDEEAYRVLVRDGLEAFLAVVLSRLHSVGHGPLN